MHKPAKDALFLADVFEKRKQKKQRLQTKCDQIF